ncbi:MAG: hypothetical protein M4579_000787 [Chaenotheca gracillima]|nr:MAG: hypothetical protein M4579_000787 [Chaenotheca gracillima]
MPGDSSWQDQIRRCLLDFSGDHDLGQAVIAKTRGLATSPTNRFTVVCFSIHPSGMIEYITRHEASSKLSFGPASGREWDGAGTPKENITIDRITLSAESFLFELQITGSLDKLFESSEPNEDEIEPHLYGSSTGTDLDRVSGSNLFDLVLDWKAKSAADPSLNALLNKNLLSTLQSDNVPLQSLSGLQPGLFSNKISAALALPLDVVCTKEIDKQVLYALARAGSLFLPQIDHLLHLCEQTFRWLEGSEGPETKTQ